MVGGQRETVDRTHPLGLAQAQGGGNRQLKPQPHHQAVGRPRPLTAAQSAGQRAEGRTAARPERPVGGLDQAATLPARRSAYQATQPRWRGDG